MPSENSFMVGNRLFKEGIRFTINFRNFRYDVKIIAVTHKQIDFTNMQTGEVVSMMLMAPN